MDAAVQGVGAKPKRRLVRRMFAGLGAGALLLFGLGLASAWPSFGASPEGERRARMEASPEWRGDRFVNVQPMWTDMWRSFGKFLQTAEHAAPGEAVPVVRDTAARLARPIRSGLRITWFGHSSSLIELDGHRVLFDPIWSERPSPVPWAGPTRWYPAPLALAALPPIEAVLISHDHYDHLDRATVLALAKTGVRFIVPLGIGAHLEAFGVPLAQMTEVDWWQDVNVGGLRVVSTPARHASGRIQPQRDETLWTGYALIGSQHRVWYSGDTGFHNALTEIGERLGPFDATLIETGQYDQLWPDWHLGPEQAVLAHQRVRGKVMIPVHWALFKLANHGWTEPAERAMAAARCLGLTILVPQPGEPVEPALDERNRRWWPEVPWKTAAQDPIVATQDGNGAHRIPFPPCVAE